MMSVLFLSPNKKKHDRRQLHFFSANFSWARAPSLPEIVHTSEGWRARVSASCIATPPAASEGTARGALVSRPSLERRSNASRQKDARLHPPAFVAVFLRGHPPTSRSVDGGGGRKWRTNAKASLRWCHRCVFILLGSSRCSFGRGACVTSGTLFSVSYSPLPSLPPLSLSIRRRR